MFYQLLVIVSLFWHFYGFGHYGAIPALILIGSSVLFLISLFGKLVAKYYSDKVFFTY